MTVITPDAELHGPDLPKSFDWPDETLSWWVTWRGSAQAKTFTPTDWAFLIDTAVLHAEFWLGDRSVAAELRLRAAKFGATPEDRARLKIEVVVDPRKPDPAPRPRAAKARRERLLRAVDGPAKGTDGAEEA